MRRKISGKIKWWRRTLFCTLLIWKEELLKKKFYVDLLGKTKPEEWNYMCYIVNREGINIGNSVSSSWPSTTQPYLFIDLERKTLYFQHQLSHDNSCLLLYVATKTEIIVIDWNYFFQVKWNSWIFDHVFPKIRKYKYFDFSTLKVYIAESLPNDRRKE